MMTGMLAQRVAAVLVLVLALSVLPWGAAARAQPDAPGFRVTLLDSRTKFDSRDRIGKRPVVVRFQASWCKPCAKEAAGFARLAERYRARGVDFIAIHVQDTTSEARKFVKAYPTPFPVALDPRLAIANRFGFKGTPTTIVIDRRGQLAARIDGESAATRLPKILDEVLAQKPR